MISEMMAVKTEYGTRVDDHRFPFGHQYRAGGLFVAARIEWRDGMAFAKFTHASGMSEKPVLQSDITEALADIEQQATQDAHLRAYGIAGDIFGDTEGTLVERLQSAINWICQGADEDLTQRERQQLRDLLEAIQ
jgi:hypothetical protein